MQTIDRQRAGFDGNAGFTLIEVMIVVAIIAILAAIAIPNYTAYVQRSRLTEATSKLSDLRTKMEVFFQDNRSYGTSGCGVPSRPATPATSLSPAT